MIRALAFPKLYARPVAGILGIAVVMLLVNSLWVPDIAPIRPAELSNGVQTLGPRGLEGNESADFIFRPLFWADRRAPENLSPATDSGVPAPIVQVAEVSIDGLTLLGTFGSGEVAGAILSDEQGQRFRMQVGDVREGWMLTDVNAREVSFATGSGGNEQLARLNLALASSLPPPKTAADEMPDASAKLPDGEAAEPARPERIGPVTFESVADQQREQMLKKMDRGRQDQAIDDK